MTLIKWHCLHCSREKLSREKFKIENENLKSKMLCQTNQGILKTSENDQIIGRFSN